MKNDKQKFIKYSSAVGALLAVSSSSMADIIPGEIMLNYTPPGSQYQLFDGDAILNHDLDFVFIDMNRDGIPDFVALMRSNSFHPSTSSSFSVTTTYNSIDVFLAAYGSSGMIAFNNTLSTFINNYATGENIGPIINPGNSGLLTMFTNGFPQTPPSSEIQTSPFSPFGDEGYVGVSVNYGTGLQYGFIQVDIDVNSQRVEFISAGLEREINTPIAAGAAPNVPLLPIASASALGLIGLMTALKKRKKAKS